MIRTGLVGVGRWGGHIARVLHGIGALAALADPDADRLARAGALYPEARRFTDLSALLAGGEVEAVAVATPPAFHAGLCREALLAGRDVFVEKPVTLRAREAYELAELAEGETRLLMVGHILLHHPAAARLLDLGRQGRLGSLAGLRGERVNPSRLKHREGVLFSLGPHDVALALALFGAPARLSAQGAPAGASGEESVTAGLQFPGGETASFRWSWEDSAKVRALTLQGRDGALLFDDLLPENKLTLLPSGEHPAYGPEEPLACEMRHFLECCKSRRAPLGDGRHAAEVMRVLEAVRASCAGGGRTVQL